MYNEELIEEGVVKESENGIATVLIFKSDYCEECSAKLYCKPGNSDDRSLTVRDPFGVVPGDKVRISIQGSKILTISFLLYGIPLLLLMVGLVVGLNIFNSSRELFATVFSLGLISVYVFIFLLFSRIRKNKTSSYPEIVFVNSK